MNVIQLVSERHLHDVEEVDELFWSAATGATLRIEYERRVSRARCSCDDDGGGGGGKHAPPATRR